VETLMANNDFPERRVCRLIGVNRSAWQYKQLRGKDDAGSEWMREIANERCRFGDSGEMVLSVQCELVST
jgi:putative transposase